MLDKNSEVFLREVYREYLVRRSKGTPEEAALSFYYEQLWPNPEWHSDKYQKCISYLSECGYVHKDVTGGFRIIPYVVEELRPEFGFDISKVDAWLECNKMQ